MLDLIKREPAVTAGLVALVGVVAAYLGFDLPEEVVYSALGSLGFTVVATRQNVTPVRR